MTLARIALSGLLIITISSCTLVLRRTFGNYIYRKDFLPSPRPKEDEFYTEIPYVVRDGWTILKVKLNDGPKEYSFIFDTGARSFVTDSIAKELGLNPIRYKKTVDTNGSVAYASLYKVDISIGKFRVNGLGILSKSNFTNLSKDCYQIDGIIGANILNQGVFHFDSEKDTLHITNSIDRIPKTKRLNKLRLINHNWSGNSMVKIKVNGKKGKFLFDTGSANLLFIEQKKASGQIPAKQRIGYIGGLHSLKIDTFSFYKIQRMTLGKEKTKIFNEHVAISYSTVENNLGNGILKKYLVTLDRREKRLYLSPKKVDTEKLEISNLQFNFEMGKVLVSSLTIDCELQKMGLILGDTITLINDIRTDSFKDYCTFSSFKDSLISNIKNKDIILTTKRGILEQKYTVTNNLLYD